MFMMCQVDSDVAMTDANSSSSSSSIATAPESSAAANRATAASKVPCFLYGHRIVCVFMHACVHVCVHVHFNLETSQNKQATDLVQGLTALVSSMC